MSDVKKAAEVLKKGEIVIFPTETSYGVGAAITNREAAKKVYEVKKRPFSKPLSVIASSLKQIEPFIEITDDVKRVSSAFHPGPLTLVVKAKKTVPDLVSKKTLAFRISSHPLARKLCELVKEPITATSANLSGEKPIYDPKKAKEKLPDIFLLDGGILKPNRASTIFDVANKTILREGPISKKEILSVLE